MIQNQSTVASVDIRRALALKLRRRILQMAHRSRASHIGGGFSMADLLASIYSGWLRVDPSKPDDPDRDRFILSKGHACAGLYAVLAHRDFFPETWLDEFYQDGTRLPGHVTAGVPGVDVSTGSLGHGLAMACGMAISLKRRASSAKVVVLLSDGECDEGSVWEAALFAPQHRLDNLVAIIDYNKIQSLGSTAEVIDLEPLGAKWTAFNWNVREIDGHDHDQIGRVLDDIPFGAGKPSCIVAHTVKGKGVSFMENQLLWHYRAPNDDEYLSAIGELDGAS